MQKNEGTVMTIEQFYQLFNNQPGEYEIETPNGWERVKIVVDKGERASYHISTEQGNIDCSFDHLLFTEEGEWKQTMELKKGDALRRKDTIEKIENIEAIGNKHVYDIEVDSVEHAYFSNDFISHNCGKTAIVEGLALKIANDDVPKSLVGKTIYALDLASMVAGTKFRGEFEDRLENTIKEVVANENVILFIDELHTIVGAGSSEGSMDSANILKPYISRGQLKIIGATTYDEYKNKIEKDKALCRRFKKIDLAEPSKDETFQILQGLRPKYEEFHGIKFSDNVLKHAVDLSAKYIVGKFFPDKAIDVIDEIGAKYHSGIKDGNEATVEDVEEVICSMANIPKISVETDDKEKLRTLGERIKSNLFGQDEIVDKIVRQVRMQKAGLANPGRPLSALFLGSTGCVTGDTKIRIRKIRDGVTPVKIVLDKQVVS